MNISGVGEIGVGVTGKGEMGQIIGETAVGEMGCGETATSQIHHFCIIGWFPADKNQYWKNR